MPKPGLIFGDWILNQGFTIVGDDIRYTGYKTNSVDTYDSFAVFDLETALVHSFHNEDMQQWQGFIDAVNELTGVSDWIVDISNQMINYTVLDTNPPYYYTSISGIKDVASEVCLLNLDYRVQASQWLASSMFTGVQYNSTDTYTYCEYLLDLPDGRRGISMTDRIFPVESRPVQNNEFSLPFNSVANKIVLNAQSSNAGIQIQAENYIDLVANSVFDTNPSKQFVKLEDLIPQLETNKVLR